MSGRKPVFNACSACGQDFNAPNDDCLIRHDVVTLPPRRIVTTDEWQTSWRLWQYRGLVKLRHIPTLPLLNIVRMEHVPGWGIYTRWCYLTFERKPYTPSIVIRGRRKSHRTGVYPVHHISGTSEVRSALDDLMRVSIESLRRNDQ